MRRQRVLIDSDGVLSCFAGAVVSLVNQHLKTNHTLEDVNQWDMYKALSVPGETGEFFDSVIRQEDFCYDLKPIEGAKEGLEELRRFADIYCVTTPFGKHRYWINERNEWLQEHMGFSEKEILPCHAKFLIAGDYLIDDKAQNLKEWEVEPHAGLAILFDQPWNRQESGFMRAKGWKDLVSTMKTLIGVA